jgi:hypothetical protein
MVIETLTRDNLVQGEDAVIMEVTVGASQTIKRGDLLELSETPVANTTTGAITVTEGVPFVRPAAKANIFARYAVASQDVTTGSGETAKISAYIKGEFDAASMRFGGSSTAADNLQALAGKGIVLRNILPA